jgi:hypothetical protein
MSKVLLVRTGLGDIGGGVVLVGVTGALEYGLDGPFISGEDVFTFSTFLRYCDFGSDEIPCFVGTM